VCCYAAQAQHVVLDGLTVVECGDVELLTQLLRRCLLHAVIAEPIGRDRVSGLLGRLLNDCRHHLQWYRATQCVKHHHLLLLISPAVLDDTPEGPRIHLHQERPILIIDLGEGRVVTFIANLMNHSLDHNTVFRGVIVGSLASRHLHNKYCNLALDTTC
jgi:hypothetical protein